LKEQSLKSKVAVVTGAGGGIGAALAKALAAEGCALALCGRRTNAIRAALRNLDSSAPVLVERCDVRQASSVEQFFRRVKQKFGRVDILINNAGVSHAMQPVSKLSEKVWRDVLDTNLTGTFLCTREALAMMPRGGAIVNNLSVASQRVFANQAAYIAAKHGVLGLTNTLREELRPKRIRVVALIPGPTATDIWDQFMPKAKRESMMSPEAVAKTVVDALKTPGNAVVEEIRLMPLAGEL
jgi:NAD(P)-dependent dehydrogenase (short-subunit alcohol dehydrogenase family)